MGHTGTGPYGSSNDGRLHDLIEASPQWSAPDDHYAAHRMAGELFGRLHAALGFGELSMHLNGKGFVFSWSFDVKGQRFGGQWIIDRYDMRYSRGLPARAEAMAEQWKASLRASV